MFIPSAVLAKDVAVIVGGGNYARGSQVSIERNTLWVKKIIEQKSRYRKTYLFYGSGPKGLPDVMVRKPLGQGNYPTEALARVFGEEKQNRESYRKSSVPGNISNTQVDNLKEKLRKVFASLKSGDTLFFIYQGHGGYDQSDRQDNYLKLWQVTRLHVSELNTLFNGIAKDVRIVFVFPQCYSGAFADLMYADPAERTVLNKQTRCGFLSQRRDREAEGCTASVNSSDYRDYSTFFFAALDGKTRTGKPLAGNPDKNGDGVVSLREAHLYALEYSESADLSRSTSEVYLERWLPWYARWNTGGALKDNDYSRIADSLAQRIGLQADTSRYLRRVMPRRADLKQRRQRLEQERDQLTSEEKGLQKKIQNSLAARWPELDYPYTNNYLKLMQSHAEEVDRAIRMNQSYPHLKSIQARLVAIEDKLLVLLREDVQLEKLYRMRKLSRIKSLFNRSASNDARKAYDRLLKCEQTALR